MSMRPATLLISCALAFGLFLAACESGHGLTVKNQTDGVVTMWEGASEAGHLEPGEEKTFSIFAKPFATTYRFTDVDGNVLFEETFTFGELKEYGDIVLTSDGSVPPDR